MNTILAWFITFNFVNIAWIFFRAKEWDDAIKVLKGMFSLDNVVIHQMFQSKLGFLSQYGISFGGMFENILGSREIIVWLFFAFILVLFFKNSMEKRDSFKPNYKLAFLTAFCFVFGILSLNKVSEFLYFNF